MVNSLKYGVDTQLHNIIQLDVDCKPVLNADTWTHACTDRKVDYNAAVARMTPSRGIIITNGINVLILSYQVLNGQRADMLCISV